MRDTEAEGAEREQRQEGAQMPEGVSGKPGLEPRPPTLGREPSLSPGGIPSGLQFTEGLEKCARA